MKFLFETVLIFSIVSSSLQIQNDFPKVKGCPPVKLMQSNISIDLINGTWYEISRDKSSFRPGKCVTVEVSHSFENNISIIYTQNFDTEVIRSNVSVTKFNATMIQSQLWMASYDSLYSKLLMKIVRHF